MTATCHACGGPMRSAYQRIGTKPAEYIVFCSRLSACPGYHGGAEATGDTEQQAIVNYNRRFNPNSDATLRR